MAPNFIYKDTITVTRPKAAATSLGGLAPAYSAQRAQDYEPLDPPLVDIMATVQAQRSGQTNPAKLPADTKLAQWHILTPLGAIPNGAVKNGDRITDQLGRIFTVDADYVGSLGARFTCSQEEV